MEMMTKKSEVKADDIVIHGPDREWETTSYSPYLVSSEKLNSLPWANSEGGIPTYPQPKDVWFFGSKLELGVLSYSNNLLYFYYGRHRTKWMQEIKGLDFIPVYISNNSLAIAIMDGFIEGKNRTFFGSTITGLGLFESLNPMKT